MTKKCEVYNVYNALNSLIVIRNLLPLFSQCEAQAHGHKVFKNNTRCVGKGLLDIHQLETERDKMLLYTAVQQITGFLLANCITQFFHSPSVKKILKISL